MHKPLLREVLTVFLRRRFNSITYIKEILKRTPSLASVQTSKPNNVARLAQPASEKITDKPCSECSLDYSPVTSIIKCEATAQDRNQEIYNYLNHKPKV